MNTALSVTGADLVRALEAAAAPRINAAVRARAEEVAVERERRGNVAQIYRRDAGSYAVTAEHGGGRR
jgi:hypothetical protein